MYKSQVYRGTSGDCCLCFTYISWCHNVIAEVAAQLVTRDVGEQGRSCDGGRRAGRCGGRRGSRRAGRRGICLRGDALTDGRILQAVAHHNKCVKAESSIHHELTNGR